MSRYKHLFLYLLTCLLIGSHAWSQEDSTKDSELKSTTTMNKSPSALRNIAVSYTSWHEKMTIKQGSLTQYSQSVFTGLKIQYEFEYARRWGSRYGMFLCIGQAQGGNTSHTVIPYVAGNQPYSGLGGFYHYAFRGNSKILMSLGPFAMYRSISWPLPTSTNVVSGNDINGGLSFDTKIYVTPKVSLHHSIGTFVIDATSFWQMGVNIQL